VAFEFGPKHGVLIYNFPEDRRPDSKSDILAFGFITVQENAQLIRITSASSNDFLELTLVNDFLPLHHGNCRTLFFLKRL
jgi:hypothetical protein